MESKKLRRGMLSEELKKKYNITQKELRLMPYFQYLLLNHAAVDPAKIDEEERKILSRWQKEGKITRPCVRGDTCSVTKEFWDFMCEILYETYVPKVEKEGEV